MFKFVCPDNNEEVTLCTAPPTPPNPTTTKLLYTQVKEKKKKNLRIQCVGNIGPLFFTMDLFIRLFSS